MKRNELIRALIQIEEELLYGLGEEIKDVIYRRFKNAFSEIQTQANKLQRECEFNQEQWHLRNEECLENNRKIHRLKSANEALKKSIRKSHGIKYY